MASNWTDLEEGAHGYSGGGRKEVCSGEESESLEFLDAGVSSHQNVGIRK